MGLEEGAAEQLSHSGDDSRSPYQSPGRCRRSRPASQEEAALAAPPSSTSLDISSEEQAGRSFESAHKFQEDPCSGPESASPHEQEESSLALERESDSEPWNDRLGAQTRDSLDVFCRNANPPHGTPPEFVKGLKPSHRQGGEEQKLSTSRNYGDGGRSGNPPERKVESRRRDTKQAGAAARFPDLSEDEEIEMITSALNAAPGVSDPPQCHHGNGGGHRRETGIEHDGGLESIPQCESPAVPERSGVESSCKKRNTGRGSKGRISSRGFISSSFGKQRKSGDASHKFYDRYRRTCTRTRNSSRISFSPESIL